MDTLDFEQERPVTGAPSDTEGPTNQPVARAFTYGDLRAYYINIGRPSPGVADLSQSDKNRLSVLKKWQEALSKTDESVVDGDLDPNADFNQLAEAFDSHLEKAGNSVRDRANKKSILAKWSGTWSEFLVHANAPSFEQYHEALKHYLDAYFSRHGRLTYTKIGKIIGAERHYVPAVLRNKTKTIITASLLPAIGNLERLLEAPKGALTRFYHLNLGAGEATRAVEQKVWKTEHASQVLRGVRELENYRLREWPAPLRKEWAGYVRHKTERFPSLLRNEAWRSSDIPEPFPSCDRLGIIGDKYSVSAAASGEFFASALGFACSFYGVDHTAEELSLSHLVNIEFIKAYIDFMESRTGRVTRTTTHTLRGIASLIHPKWGYLTQIPETFAQRHPEGIMQKDWPKFCSDTYDQIKDIIRRLKEGGSDRPSRDPESGIRPALERKHPITYLLDLIDRVALYLEKQSFWLSVDRRLNLERFLMVLRMMVYQPLRIKMFSVMEVGEGTKNNLYKRSDGCWAIRFKPEDFKNTRGAAVRKYDVAFPESMTAHIERYLFEVRPGFISAASPYVFPTYRTKHSMLAAKKFSQQFRKNTALFVAEDECMFSPHAVRHIVATDYIKNNPNGFQVAADVLHDTLSTVLKAYAHLKAEDGHRHYQRYLEDVIALKVAA